MSKLARIPYWSYYQFSLSPEALVRMKRNGDLPSLIGAVGRIMGIVDVQIERCDEDSIEIRLRRGSYDELISVDFDYLCAAQLHYTWYTPDQGNYHRISRYAKAKEMV